MQNNPILTPKYKVYETVHYLYEGFISTSKIREIAIHVPNCIPVTYKLNEVWIPEEDIWKGKTPARILNKQIEQLKQNAMEEIEWEKHEIHLQKVSIAASTKSIRKSQRNIEEIKARLKKNLRRVK